MTIINRLIPINRYNRPGEKCTPKKICLHWTANPGSGANNAAAYQANVARGIFKDYSHDCWTSSQYVVGIMGEIIRCVPDNEVAYAAANNNVGVIHIEVCHADSSGVFSSAAVKALSELVPYLMNRYRITAANVVRHYDLTGKQCPLYYINEKRWAALKKAITTPPEQWTPCVGDRVTITAPYAPSAYAKTAAATTAIGQRRYITQVYANAAYPYRLGVKKGDNSTANTIGFAAKGGLKKT